MSWVATISVDILDLGFVLDISSPPEFMRIATFKDKRNSNLPFSSFCGQIQDVVSHAKSLGRENTYRLHAMALGKIISLRLPS